MNVYKQSLLFALLVLTGANFLNSLDTIFTRRANYPSFSRRLTVDSELYAGDGLKLANQSLTSVPTNLVYSVPVRLLVSYFVRVFHTSPLLYFKVLNLILLLLISLLVGRMVYQKTNDPFWGVLAAFLLSFSNLISAYTAIVQHEIIMAFLMTVLLYLTLPRTTLWRAVGTGVVIMLLASFRISYLSLFPLGLVLFGSREKGEKSFRIPFILAFFIPSLAWNIFVSWSSGTLYVFHPPGIFTLKKHLNPNALPFNFPYGRTMEPAGVSFVSQYPLHSLQLCVDHFAYLFGLKADGWYILSRWGRLVNLFISNQPDLERFCLVAAQTLLFWLGWKQAEPRSRERIILCFFILALCAPHLAVGGSTRFLVPFLPAFIFMQTLGIASSYLYLRQRTFVIRRPELE